MGEAQRWDSLRGGWLRALPRVESATLLLSSLLQVLNFNATEADEAYIFIRDHMLGRLYT